MFLTQAAARDHDSHAPARIYRALAVEQSHGLRQRHTADGNLRTEHSFRRWNVPRRQDSAGKQGADGLGNLLKLGVDASSSIRMEENRVVV